MYINRCCDNLSTFIDTRSFISYNKEAVPPKVARMPVLSPHYIHVIKS